MGAELRELSQLAAPAPGSEPSGPRDFTFEDKRRLSQQLGSLPGEVCTVALPCLSAIKSSSVSPSHDTQPSGVSCLPLLCIAEAAAGAGDRGQVLGAAC